MKDGLMYVGIAVFVGFLILSEIKGSRRSKAAKKRCRYCHNIIPYEATVCPYCRRKPGVDFGAEGKFFLGSLSGIKMFVVFLIIFMIICVAVAFS